MNAKQDPVKESYLLSSGVLLQRLWKDLIWYATKDNRIVDHSQYRHDLEEKWK
jgi:hypothetical protein